MGKPSVAGKPSAAGEPAIAGKPSVACDPPAAGDVLRAEANVIATLTKLARRLRQPRTTVGYSAFLFFALEYKCRPIIWEGETPVDLIHDYAPWAESLCVTA